MNIAETIHHKSFTIQIAYDEDPLNPRTDYDHACKMMCWLRNYNCGDKPFNQTKDDAESLCFLPRPDYDEDAEWVRLNDEDDEARAAFRENDAYSAAFDATRITTLKALREREDYLDSLPRTPNPDIVWRTLHFGYRADSVSSSDPCDDLDGADGIVYFDLSDRKQVQEWFAPEYIKDKPLRDAVMERLQSEVEEYDLYCRGECYGYTVTDPDGEELDDGALWGFLGDIKYCIDEAKSAVDHEAKDWVSKIQVCPLCQSEDVTATARVSVNHPAEGLKNPRDYHCNGCDTSVSSLTPKTYKETDDE